MVSIIRDMVGAVFKDEIYDEPTVVCEAVKLDRPSGQQR